MLYSKYLNTYHNFCSEILLNEPLSGNILEILYRRTLMKESQRAISKALFSKENLKEPLLKGEKINHIHYIKNQNKTGFIFLSQNRIFFHKDGCKLTTIMNKHNDLITKIV